MIPLAHGVRPALLGLAVGVVLACSRTSLEGYREVAPGPLDDAAVDAAAIAPSPEAGGACRPTGPETCNDIDDDCNGAVDDVPAIPCPAGGQRYCVAGHYSECPRRCEACFPGSQVVCFISYCKYWGVQTCAGDGRTLSGCREQTPPNDCLATAKSEKESPALEQCCIDNGYCCADDFDLDHDGNTSEMLGRCDEVVCGP